MIGIKCLDCESFAEIARIYVTCILIIKIYIYIYHFYDTMVLSDLCCSRARNSSQGLLKVLGNADEFTKLSVELCEDMNRHEHL